MKSFKYSAVDADGIPHTGSMKAVSRQQASDALRARNYIVTSLNEENANSVDSFLNRFRGVPTQDKVVFTRQLGTMIGSGLPINQALRILANQTRSEYFAQVINDIVRQIDGGSSFYNALSQYEKEFGRLYLSLIKAGEASGNLENILSRLADTMEAETEFKGKVQGALIYPAIIVFVMVLVLGIMFFFVIPRLAELYEDLDADLPFMTQILIDFSGALTKYWWLFIVGLVGGWFGLRQLMKNPEIEDQVARVKLKTPVFGELSSQVQLTSFTRTLGMLVSSGIPLLEAIDISKETLANRIYRKAAEDSASMIEKGKTLADAFKQHEEFPPLLSEMLAVGEQTGKVDDVLQKISQYFESEASRKTDNLASAIEPIVMVVLGVMVGFLVISLIMPIYSLTSQI
ncbi:type II secretion system F family protein [candidate division WWE3 bacterium]|nr:type II secretion system F family protein [candidate division WWE3 bacterium]